MEGTYILAWKRPVKFVGERTFDSLRILFNSEDECARVLFEARWPNGFRCPRCEHPHAYVISTRRLPLYQCQSCGAQTSLIAGTVMEGSRTPLRLWFQAIYLHSQPCSVNALQLSQAIGVTYKTAWLICHKLRHAMSSTESNQLLSGIVHVTDDILCKRYIPSTDWHIQEQSVLIGSTSNEQGEILHIKIKKQSKQPLRSPFAPPVADQFIRENVAPEATSRTIVTRRIGPDRNKALLQICYEAEKWLAWTFLGIGPKHLQAYLDQFCYMWNRQKQSVFTHLVQACSVTRAITYPTLTNSTTMRSTRLPRKSVAASSLAS